eukprot:1527408-Amphidinium_carterae.2
MKSVLQPQSTQLQRQYTFILVRMAGFGEFALHCHWLSRQSEMIEICAAIMVQPQDNKTR